MKRLAKRVKRLATGKAAKRRPAKVRVRALAKAAKRPGGLSVKAAVRRAGRRLARRTALPRPGKPRGHVASKPGAAVAAIGGARAKRK